MGQRSEVLYDGGKCTSLLLRVDLLFFVDAVAKPLNDMADLKLLFFFLDVNSVICTCTLVAAARAHTCLASRGHCSAWTLRPNWLRCSLSLQQQAAPATCQLCD